MRNSNALFKDPITLTLAADCRLCNVDYTNDQIWQLFAGGDPVALGLETTYGLRAKSMRIFNRIMKNNQTFCDPNQFTIQPRLLAAFPNYFSLSYSPFSNLEIINEYWISNSQSIAGRMSFQNRSLITEQFRIELISQLIPLGEGQRMVVNASTSIPFLQGKTNELIPTLLASSGAQPGTGSFPAMFWDINLSPGNKRSITWVLSSLNDPHLSLDMCRKTISKNWDAEIARIQLVNRNQNVEIQTGSTDWDIVFDQSQRMANGLILNGTNKLPNKSFVVNRLPDSGYSHNGDGTDYPPFWNGQSPFDAYFLNSIILPGGVQLAKEIFENFLFCQESNGFIDAHPGLGGQRAHYLAQPMLASLACQLSPHIHDSEWLKDIYPGLLSFIRHWMNSDNDKDHDGVPEWQRANQTSLVNAPIYDYWHTQSQGVDITSLETPSMSSFVYNELRCLSRIAHTCKDSATVSELEMKASQVREHAQSTWDQKNSIYHYRDVATHHHGAGKLLLSKKGSGKFDNKNTFSVPQRVLITITDGNNTLQPVSVNLFGKDEQGQVVENISSRMIHWGDGIGRATSQTVFSKLDMVEVEGVHTAARIQISTINYKMPDISLLLPLWAKIPDQKLADLMIKKTIENQFLQNCGIPMSPLSKRTSATSHTKAVLIPWNNLVGEGMLQYGNQIAAAKLITRLMNTIIHELKQSHSFREAFLCDNGIGIGDFNALYGLAPLGLFLKTLGIKKLNQSEIILNGFNPFPWPVTVKYQGTTITRNLRDTVIKFSSGQTISVDGTEPKRINLS